MEYPDIIEIPRSEVKLIKREVSGTEYIALIEGSGTTVAGAMQDSLIRAKQIERLFAGMELKFTSHRKVSQSREKRDDELTVYSAVIEVIFVPLSEAKMKDMEKRESATLRKIVQIYEQLAAVDPNVPITDFSTRARFAGIGNFDELLNILISKGIFVKVGEEYIRKA